MDEELPSDAKTSQMSTEENPSVDTQNELTQSTPSTLKRKNILLLLFGIIFLFLIGAGFQYFQNAQKEDKKVPPVAPTSTPTITIDPTVNWKTYRNEDYGFELKYPSDLEVTENTILSGIDFESRVKMINFIGNSFSMSITLEPNTKQYTIDEWLDSVRKAELEECLMDCRGFSEESQPITVAGNKAHLQYLGSVAPTINVYIPLSTHIAWVSSSHDFGINNFQIPKSTENTLLQILSTFKVIQ